MRIPTTKVKLWWSKAGNAHNIGEPSGRVPEEILDRCFSRMAVWVRLSICVLKQEYPDYELVSCFGVLSLDMETSAGCFSLSDDQERSLARLAKAFKLDFRQLVEEFRLLSPLAARILVREKVSNQEAWRRAVGHWRSGRSARSLIAINAISHRHRPLLGHQTIGIIVTHIIGGAKLWDGFEWNGKSCPEIFSRSELA